MKNTICKILFLFGLTIQSLSATADPFVPISHFKFDGNFSDEQGFTNILSVGNTQFGNGRIGQSFVLDGSSNYIETNQSNMILKNLGDNNAYTISTWVKMNQSHYGIIFNAMADANDTFSRLSVEANGSVRFVNQIGDTDINQIFSPSLTYNTWHHIVATYSEDNGSKLYINGVLVGTNSANFEIEFSNYDYETIGAYRLDEFETAFLNGELDDFRIYNYVLNQSEVSSLYVQNLYGTPYDDNITGTEENDFINVSDGDDTISGANGDDTIIYDENLSAYIITLNQDGSYSVVKPNNKGVDTLISIEYLSFDDAQNQPISDVISIMPTDIILNSEGISENQELGINIGSFSSIDESIDVSHIYSFCGGVDDSNFAIDGNSLVANISFNYELKSSYSICVKTTNSNSFSYDKNITINIENVNEAPQLETNLSNSLTLQEDTGVNSFTLNVSDEDMNDLDITVESSNPNIIMVNQSWNSQLTYNSYNNSILDFNLSVVPNASGVAQIKIIVNDGDANTTQDFNISVFAVNDAPSDLQLSNSQINEQISIGSVVGTFNTTDIDSSVFTYSLVAGDGSSDNQFFAINNNALVTNGMFDYEEKNSYSIRVRSTDSQGGYFDKIFTVSIVNIDHTSASYFDLEWMSSDETIEETLSGVIFSPTTTKESTLQSNVAQTFKEVKAKIVPHALNQTASFNMTINGRYNLMVFDKSIKIEQIGDNGISIDTQNLYDEDNSTSFNEKVLHLHLWINGEKVYANVTDELNNQIGRVVEYNTTLESFDEIKFEAKIGNQTSSNIELFGVELNSTPLLVQIKRFDFLTNSITLGEYNNAVAINSDAIVMYKLALVEDLNKYINKTITQLVKKDSKTYVSFIEINGKNKIINDFKSSTNLVERKYIEEISYSSLASIFRDGGIFAEFSADAKGYRVYEKNATGATTQSIMLNKIALEELFYNLKLNRYLPKSVTISNLWTYVALPTEINLCIASYQSSLPALCDESNTIESVFNSVDTVYKHQGYWSYWDRNNANYSFDKIGILNGKDGLLVKSQYSNTLNLPFDIIQEISTELIDFHQKGWYLTHIPFEMTPSELGLKVAAQNKILKHILIFRNNTWEIYAPQNDNNFASTIIRIQQLNSGDVVWVEVE